MTRRGLTGAGARAWLFASKKNSARPVSSSAVNAALAKARAASGVSTSVVLHTLRHFYASALINAGCDVATVQHALGHSTPVVTLNTYTHLWPKSDDVVRDALDVLLTRPQTSSLAIAATY